MIPAAVAGQEEQELLRDSVRGFLGQRWPVEHAVAGHSDVKAQAAIWRGLAGQGLAALGADADLGGMVEVLVVMEELGRAACPVPLQDAVLANLAFGDSREPQVRDLLAALHKGEAMLAWSFGAADGDAGAGAVAVRGNHADGVLRFVDAGSAATHVLVAAFGDQALALLSCAGPACAATPARAMGMEGQAQLTFSNAPAVTLPCLDRRMPP